MPRHSNIPFTLLYLVLRQSRTRYSVQIQHVPATFSGVIWKLFFSQSTSVHSN